MELIRIYSWDIDFQRSIRSGDKFEVLFERIETNSGKLARYGNILYANLKLGKLSNPLYLFKKNNKIYNHFDEKGHSAKKALMRTPINGARLSSGYGTRRHPILGYNKMHRGVDFAAPIGTPILAAGSGTIVFRSRNGAYGNYIRIRHNSLYSTAYAHLSKFNRSLTKGSRVRQGQVIGYVGTTGRSTGAHLHYEILKRGRQTNPRRVKMPSGTRLGGADLHLFKKTKDRLKTLLQNVKVSNRVEKKLNFQIP
jgi:murein DD-endopeptidase MepM/ murein hydrolase activator NlpD